MYYRPFREPDALDAMLANVAYEMRHESRMNEIREMNIEAWVSEVLNE